MKKRASLIIIVIAFVIVIGSLAIITWWSIGKMSNNDSNKAQENTRLINETESDLDEGANINDTENNPLENKTIEDSIIFDPTGDVSFISRDGKGEYFCNTSINPKHSVRVYAYKIINGTKDISIGYIESKKIQVCDDYDNESVTNGINYEIEWNWNAVDNADGYRVYQYYYLNKNISRDYINSIDVKTNKLLDTNLNLWK